MSFICPNTPAHSGGLDPEEMVEYYDMKPNDLDYLKYVVHSQQVWTWPEESKTFSIVDGKFYFIK